MKILSILFFLPLMACSSQERTPPEIGLVDWQTDHDKAFALATKADKPVFLLFQEVPG